MPVSRSGQVRLTTDQVRFVTRPKSRTMENARELTEQCKRRIGDRPRARVQTGVASSLASQRQPAPSAGPPAGRGPPAGTGSRLLASQRVASLRLPVAGCNLNVTQPERQGRRAARARGVPVAGSHWGFARGTKPAATAGQLPRQCPLPGKVQERCLLWLATAAAGHSSVCCALRSKHIGLSRSTPRRY